jgi:PAS domain S-box-containing protein
MRAKTVEFPYAQLFDAIPIGLYRRTPAGKLIDVNPALVEASGWPDRESLLAIEDVQWLYANPEDLTQLHDVIQRDGVVRNFETRLHRHHDPPLWVEINAVAVRDENGEISCYEGTITPIATRKEMEIELRRSEQRLRAIMNALDEVVAIVDREQRFVAVMGQRLQAMGFVPDTVVGKTVYEVFGEQHARVHEAAGARALEGERVVYQWQTDVFGSPRWFQISLFPLRESTGEVVGVVATAYDMTHLKQTQEKLAHALAEKDALLKEVHHRVKNNLQIISSLLNLQFDRVPDPGLRAMVMEIQHRIRAMALVHEQLYRSETLMRLDTRVFLDSLVSSLVRSYAVSGEPVNAVVDADAMPLDLDVAIPIALVINELVSNSLKHAFAGPAAAPRLVVSLRRTAEGKRRLVVSDNGVGMPRDFDLARAQTLGLSLVMNLVQQIGGVVTSRIAAGTEFIVDF